LENWYGAAKTFPYNPALHPINWRWQEHFGGEQLIDWFCHHVDSALWKIGLDGTDPL
jgi:predicted dehydrogenase